MSKKDFDIYYNQVCEQYMELKEQIKDFEKVVQEGMVEPERLENMKKVFQPVMQSYEMISWVAYLLNQPVKKEKHKNYSDMMMKKIDKLDKKYSKEGIITTNQKALDKLSDVIHNGG